MKTLTLISCLFLGLSLSAQTANFSSSNAKQTRNNNVVFTFTLTNLSSAAQATVIADKMKAFSKQVVSVNVTNATATQAELNVMTGQDDNIHTLQNAFTAAEILDFTVDGTAYKTKDMFEVAKQLKKK